MSSLSEAESRIRYARRYYRHLYGSATRVELCFSEDDYGYIVWPDAILEHDTAKNTSEFQLNVCRTTFQTDRLRTSLHALKRTAQWG